MTQATTPAHAPAQSALADAGGHRARESEGRSPALEPGRDLVAACLHADDPAIAQRTALISRVAGTWVPMTYRQLDERSRAVAAWLADRGIAVGDRVGLAGEGSSHWVTALLGILRAGAVAVPIDPKLTRDELGELLARADLGALAVSAAVADAVQRAALAAAVREPARPTSAPDATQLPMLALHEVGSLPAAESSRDIPRGADDPALIVWTSGTTSAAKGVTLSLGNLAYVVEAVAAGQELDPDDRVLAVLPPHHMLALSCSVLAPVAAGASVAFADTLMPHELLATLAEQRSTKVVAVPLLLEMLMRHLRSAASPPDLTGLPLTEIYSGGAPLDPATIAFFATLGIGVHEGYGLTETAPTIAMNTAAGSRPGSVGRALPGTEIRIDAGDGEHSGEILVRSPAVMLGYWRDEAATRAAIDPDGWLRTGDLGRLDPDGFLWITGRAKRLIVLPSGKKVSPEEVEVALAGSPLLAEVCVLGWRDPGKRSGGEQVCAVVVPDPAAAKGAADLQEEIAEEVRRLTAGLSGYKRPTAIRIIARPLPRSAKGAVRHGAVRDLLDQDQRAVAARPPRAAQARTRRRSSRRRFTDEQEVQA